MTLAVNTDSEMTQLDPSTEPARDEGDWSATILCQNFLGHRTHANLLDYYLRQDTTFRSSVIRFSVDDYPEPRRLLLRLLGARLPLRIAHRTDGDLWASRNQLVQGFIARRALRSVGEIEAPLYIHSHSAAGWIPELPRKLPTIVSLDGTLIGELRMRRSGQLHLDRGAVHREKQIFDRANLLITFSDWARQSVINDYGISPSKVRTIRNAIIPVETRVEDKPEGLRDIRLPIVGFVGNDFERKGGNLLLQSHQRYLADRSHLVLVTGERIRTDQLKNVSVLSSVPRDLLLSSIVPWFAVLAHPAYLDWSPYSVIEALSSGLPIVSSAVGSLPEMVSDGKNGFVLEALTPSSLAAAIDKVLSDSSLSREMSSESRRRFNALYHADRNYGELLEAIREFADRQSLEGYLHAG